ncbi:hypothetical protein [Thermococcus peptonophilus]|uniref:hypothetical protein n=1 Tax=Thermococcus peptonophilus TaxID=53952 RepID=UPI0006D213E1
MNIEGGTNIFPWYYPPNYPGACEYFDYIFAQPNYYMGRISNINGWVLNLEGSKLKYNCWNVFMEMEADECVIGGGGNCKTCSDSNNCTKLASDYIQAQINNIGRKYSQRAYYFGVTFDVVRHVDSYCRNNLGGYRMYNPPTWKLGFFVFLLFLFLSPPVLATESLCGPHPVLGPPPNTAVSLPLLKSEKTTR